MDAEEVFRIHPDSSKWFFLKWNAAELGSSTTIDTTSWTLPAALNQDDKSTNGLSCGIKLSVNTVDALQHRIELEIQTSAGETLHKSVIVDIDERAH